MPRSANAQLAIDMYEKQRGRGRWGGATAGRRIVRIPLSCEQWRHGWQTFRRVVLYREANDFKTGKRNADLGEDGRLAHLRSLEWLVGETSSW